MSGLITQAPQFLSLHTPEMPLWQRAKSYLSGSLGSSLLRLSVISTAIFQSGVFLFVSPRQSETRFMWVSKGITSLEGGISFHIPKSMSFLRTIHLKKRHALFLGLFALGDAKRSFKPL